MSIIEPVARRNKDPEIDLQSLPGPLGRILGQETLGFLRRPCGKKQRDLCRPRRPQAALGSHRRSSSCRLPVEGYPVGYDGTVQVRAGLRWSKHAHDDATMFFDTAQNEVFVPVVLTSTHLLVFVTIVKEVH